MRKATEAKYADWQAAIASVKTPTGSKGASVADICKQTGRCKETVTKKLIELIEAGVVEMDKEIRPGGFSQKLVPVHVFRLKK